MSKLYLENKKIQNLINIKFYDYYDKKGDNLSNLEPLREKEMLPLALGESGKSNFLKKGPRKDVKICTYKEPLEPEEADGGQDNG